MCVITTAVAGSTAAMLMANASIAASVAGAAMSAYGSYQQGQAQSAQADYQSKLAARNAQQAQMQADYERESGKEAADQQRRAVRQTIGTQRSLLSASGVDVTDADSSAANILGDSAQWGEYDALKIQHQNELKAWGYENQGAQEQANSLMYSQGAKQSSRAGAIGAGAGLLSGLGQVAGQWYQYGKETKKTG